MSTDTPHPATPHVRTVDGQQVISIAGNAILFGVTEEQMRRQLPKTAPTSRVLRLPETWVKAGRRRSREAQAATGGSDIGECIAWLEARDRGEAL